MDIELLKKIISEQEDMFQERLRTGKIIPREHPGFTPKEDLAMLITGPRRAGKSTFALLSAKGKPSAHINFDDERLGIPSAELNDVLEAFHSLKGNPEILIFDEIQNVPGWEKFITRVIPTKKVVITGSNSNLLGSELATHMTGRHIDMVLLPFSFREFLLYAGFTPDIYLTHSISKIKASMEKYLSLGGFPLAGSEPDFLQRLFSDIVQKDVILRYKPHRAATVRDLARLLASNSGNEITYSKLAHVLNVKSPNTIQKYLSYLESAYLVFRLERFSYKLKERVMAPKKIYAIDTGFIGLFSAAPSFGQVMETAAAVEILRRTTFEKKTEAFYWRDHVGHEIDFVIVRDGKVAEILQCCFDSSNPLTLERELRAFPGAARALRTKNAILLTRDDEKEIFRDGLKIRLVPLWKWLLSYSPPSGGGKGRNLTASAKPI